MIKNPILPGFNPDPSVCRVGDDYYIATSTFEWFPGIMIYHSRDMINWKLISRPLNRESQLEMVGNRNSGGIWAPHLTYADNKFWLLITDVKTDQLFKDTLNYLMTCETIDGEWSDPVYINSSGFDPALFHDEDGKKYIMNMLWDYRPHKPNFNGIVMQEYDVLQNKLIGERQCIFRGTQWGVTEGPQILKKDGWYYLICAEGGTGYHHATVVTRSKCIWGPYEVSPYTPLITTWLYPNNSMQKAGHASFVQVGEDEWYITHLCARPLTKRGNCTLGRETGMAKIEWIEGWPQLATGGNEPSIEIQAPKIAEGVMQQVDYSTATDFEQEDLPDYFHTLRAPLGDKMSLTERKGYLRLYGEQCLASLHRQTLVARRWQSFSFRAQTALEFRPKDFQQMAGLTCYYSTENWMYLYVSYDEDLQSRIINILVCDLAKTTAPLDTAFVQVPDDVELIHLAVEVERDQLQFEYSFDGENFNDVGPILPADHLSDDYIEQKNLVFTGALVGICAQDMSDQSSYADFDYFTYAE